MNKWLYWLWRHLPIPEKLRGLILWVGNRKFVIGIAALILNGQGEILLFKHTYRTDCDWGFPGGYLQGHEEPGAAIQREILEESGLTARVFDVLEVIRSEDMARLEILFKAELVGELQFTPSHEVVAAQFFPVESLPELLPEHRVLIEKYCGPRAVDRSNY